MVKPPKQPPTKVKANPKDSIIINKLKLEQLSLKMSQQVSARYKKDLSRRQLVTAQLSAPPYLYQVPAMISSSHLTISNKSDGTPKQVQRQLQTYQITQENVNKFMDELKAMKIRLDRPHDYLAEMYKSDTHMGKIRKHLAEKETNIKEAMQNKKWEKRKKKAKKRGLGADKVKLIKKYKGSSSKGKDGKAKAKPKAPKMMKIKGKRKQKK